MLFIEFKELVIDSLIEVLYNSRRISLHQSAASKKTSRRKEFAQHIEFVGQTDGSVTYGVG